MATRRKSRPSVSVDSLSKINFDDKQLSGQRVKGPGHRNGRYITATSAESWLVERARVDPYYFIYYISGLEPAAHHKIWLSNIFHPDRKRINIVGPRYSAKTTIAVLCIAFIIGKAPQLSSGILSVASDQAEARLRMLKSLVRDNARFRNVFPNIKIDEHRPNTNTEFSVYDTNMTYSAWRSLIAMTIIHPTIFASGVEGSTIIGHRISGIFFFDDIIDSKYLSDILQTKIMELIVRDFLPCMTEEGKIISIGTRWMLNDIYERFINNPVWTSIVIPAILFDTSGKRYSYWPEFWDLERLDAVREEMANDMLFRIMYLCDPRAVTLDLFKREHVERDLPEVLPAFDSIYITSDFAVSQKTKADWNVLFAVGVDRDRNLYLLSGIRYREIADSSLNRISMFANEVLFLYGRLDMLVMENVAFQAVYQQLLYSSRPDIPVFGHRPAGDKNHRASTLNEYMRRDRVFINQKLPFIAELHSEYMNFGVHPYDDTVDALSILVQYLGFSATPAKLSVIKVPFML